MEQQKNAVVFDPQDLQKAITPAALKLGELVVTMQALSAMDPEFQTTVMIYGSVLGVGVDVNLYPWGWNKERGAAARLRAKATDADGLQKIIDDVAVYFQAKQQGAKPFNPNEFLKTGGE